MESIIPEKGEMPPKQIQIVNKTYIVTSAARLEPAVDSEDSAKMPSSTGQCGDKTKNKKFPWVLKKLKRLLTSFLVSSHCWRAAQFLATWTITQLVEEWSERSTTGSLSSISGTMAPGRQWVAALKNQKFLIMECPTINVVFNCWFS